MRTDPRGAGGLAVRRIIPPSDEPTFRRTAEQLIDDFEDWIPEALEVDICVLRNLLFYKWQADGRLLHWTPGELTHALTCAFPKHFVAMPECLRLTLPTLTSFVRFLDATELLDEASARPDELVGELNDAEEAYFRCMDDPSLYAPNKRLLLAATDDGVDVFNEQALTRWMEDLDRGPQRRIEEVLGPPPTEPEFRFDPVRVPSVEEAEAAASSAPLMERLRTFVSYIGNGKPLTKKGHLRLADGRALVHVLGTTDHIAPDVRDFLLRARSSADLPRIDTFFRWARKSGLVRVARGKVVPTKLGRALDSSTYQAWSRAVQALIELSFGRSRDHTPFYSEVLDEEIEGALFNLYTRESQEVDSLAETAWRIVLKSFVLDGVEDIVIETYEGMVRADVVDAVEQLSELGVISWTGFTERDVYGYRQRKGGQIALTPLGRLWINGSLREEGADAPVLGELAGVAAPEFLAALADASPSTVAEEVEARIEARGADVVLAELTELTSSGEPVHRFAFAVFDVVGEGAARELVGDADLGACAMAWLADRGQDTLGELDFELDPEVDVELLSVLLEQGGGAVVVRELERSGSQDDQMARLSGFIRAFGPHTEPVLEARPRAPEQARGQTRPQSARPAPLRPRQRELIGACSSPPPATFLPPSPGGSRSARQP